VWSWQRGRNLCGKANLKGRRALFWISRWSL
jgi:hypothetical protein